jgi:hypothetical protein
LFPYCPRGPLPMLTMCDCPRLGSQFVTKAFFAHCPGCRGPPRFRPLRPAPRILQKHSPAAPAHCRLRERIVWPTRVVSAGPYYAVEPSVPAQPPPAPDLRPPITDDAASFLQAPLPSVISSVSSDGIRVVIRPRKPGRVVNVVGVRPVVRVLLTAGAGGSSTRPRKPCRRPNKSTRVHAHGTADLGVFASSGVSGDTAVEPDAHRQSASPSPAGTAAAPSPAPGGAAAAYVEPPVCCERGHYGTCELLCYRNKETPHVRVLTLNCCFLFPNFQISQHRPVHSNHKE